MIFSSRSEWSAPVNRLTEARRARRGRGEEILDLTVTNPTTAGLDYPHEELSAALESAAVASYDPHPRGMLAAREALAEYLSEQTPTSPDDLILTASTSEAYSYLFKLLTEPGDAVVTGRPTYPLLDHLTALELTALRHFEFTLEGTGDRRHWTPDFGSLTDALAGGRVRAAVAVHPNNPTGGYFSSGEAAALTETCARSGVALVSDEVFFEYELQRDVRHAPTFAAAREGLVFVLGGLSKTAALPHWKLGWIRIAGDAALRQRASSALELISDTYLSVATPVQVALPAILRLAPAIRDGVIARCRENLGTIRGELAGDRSLDPLPVEGGWSAVIRVPRFMSDEELCLDLLDRRGVFVQPGYFYDFAREGHLVVSLLTPREVMREGVRRLAAHMAELAR